MKKSYKIIALSLLSFSIFGISSVSAENTIQNSTANQQKQIFLNKAEGQVQNLQNKITNNENVITQRESNMTQREELKAEILKLKQIRNDSINLNRQIAAAFKNFKQSYKQKLGNVTSEQKQAELAKLYSKLGTLKSDFQSLKETKSEMLTYKVQAKQYLQIKNFDAAKQALINAENQANKFNDEKKTVLSLIESL